MGGTLDNTAWRLDSCSISEAAQTSIILYIALILDDVVSKYVASYIYSCLAMILH